MVLQVLLFLSFALIVGLTQGHGLFVGDRLVGIALLLVGVAVLSAAVVAYRKSIGTYKIKATPEPADRGGLMTDGIYSFIRHPFYTATPTMFLGFALLAHRPWGLVILPFVVGLLYWKSTHEEDLLEAKFPEYAAYRARTGRFLPPIGKNLWRSR
jgi:protein-S-isoprenylcysteine O-methyltransferase Ste14